MEGSKIILCIPGLWKTEVKLLNQWQDKVKDIFCRK